MNLFERKCRPCEGGTPPLPENRIGELLQEVPTWKVENGKLVRTIRFPDFLKAIEFVNRMAELAEAEDHHPDFCVFGYRNLSVSLMTHAIGGLSENDFILAAKIDRIPVPERRKAQKTG